MNVIRIKKLKGTVLKYDTEKRYDKTGWKSL